MASQLAQKEVDELKKIYRSAVGSLGEKEAEMLTREGAAAMMAPAIHREATVMLEREAGQIFEAIRSK